jgi:hypothetical protein
MENFSDGSTVFQPFEPEEQYPLNSNFVYEVRSLLADEDVPLVCLRGVNKLPDSFRRPCGAARESRYSLGVEFDIALGERLLLQEIRLPMRGAAFAIRMLHWQIDPSVSIGPLLSLRVRLLDEELQAFSNDLVPADFMFRRGINGHLAGLPEPEIVIPEGRAHYFDAEVNTDGVAGAGAGGVYPTVLGVLSAVMPEQQNYGPFVFGANRFVLGFRLADGFITVAKSADAGVSWSESDAAGAKAQTFPIFACCPDADYPVTPLIHCVFLGAGSIWTHAAFNTSTETWGASTASVLGFTAGPPSPNTNDNAPFIAHRETDGFIVLFVASVLELVGAGNRWRCQYATFDPTLLAWSGYTQVGTVGGDAVNYLSNACVRGDGFTHFFYRFVPVSALVDMELRHVSLSDAGALAAAQTIVTGVQSVNPFRRTSAASSRDVAGVKQILVPIRVNSVPDYFLQIISGDSAASPVWTVTTIAFGPRIQVGFPGDTAAPLVVWDQDGTLFARWGFNSFTDVGDIITALIRQSSNPDPTAAWPAASLFYTQPDPTYAVGSASIGGRAIAADNSGFMAEFSGPADPILNYWEGSGALTGPWRCMLVFTGALLHEGD